MNIHVSECKYYCLHLVPKFGDVPDRQNRQRHPTVYTRHTVTYCRASNSHNAIMTCLQKCLLRPFYRIRWAILPGRLTAAIITMPTCDKHFGDIWPSIPSPDHCSILLRQFSLLPCWNAAFECCRFRKYVVSDLFPAGPISVIFVLCAAISCNCEFPFKIEFWSRLWISSQIVWWIYVRKIKNRAVVTTTGSKMVKTALTMDRVRVWARVRLGLVSNSVSSR